MVSRTAMDRALRWMRRPAVAVLLLGVVLHLTVRDRYPVLATVFYGLPLPILTLGWLGAALAGKQGLISRAVKLSLGVACGLWWHGSSYQNHVSLDPLPGQRELKVLYWNLAHRRLPHDGVARLLAVHRPDIAGFVETGRISGDPNPLVTDLPDGYQMLKTAHGTAVLVRGSARVLGAHVLPSRSKYLELELTVDGQSWRLFIVDGVSSPIRSRQDVLEQVLAQARDKPRTLIVGDFNTPRESVWLTPWREAFHHAFDEAGHGWSETWPRQSPLPLLSIDHIWSSKDLLPLTAQKLWSPESDHAALLTTLRVNAP
ncbi:endonuclease/exonuclease/phosphatase family protein [Verrucomicrobium sp. BvORR034]|uniref:endonuclease/exonuclease/phosphatase family protein n=1 Tax=Verrucomicrobium sp. BvORR034 TaxID=1396418 RepID=UPI0009DEAE05|nr:endonuclease/exonuclease/phosphatase family protein [Verrucomicrobium sp. BvORR034]